MSLKTVVFRGMCQFCVLSRTQTFSIKLTRHTHKFTHTTSSPDTKYEKAYRDVYGTIEDEKTAKDFVYALKKGERSLIYEELRKFHGDKTENEVSEGAVQVPTSQQLKIVLLHNLLPFIGFGFLDNFFMITVGDWIELTFGQKFGISVLAAAGFGNLVSDVLGLGLFHYVEVLCSKFGFRPPPLTPDQVDMKRTRFAANIGKAVGIIIGCLLGMFPLLFMSNKSDCKEEDPSKSKEELNTITNVK